MKGLAKDYQLRRQHGMTEFRSPYRFPDPTEMGEFNTTHMDTVDK